MRWAPSPWRCQDPPLATELESVSGRGGVLLTRAGKAQPAEEGDTLQAGDRLAVGAKTAARILFDDGTHLTLAEGCAVELARPLQGAAGVVLQRGSLAANVAKAPAPAPTAASAAPLKFFIRTNAAVMGVRGEGTGERKDGAHERKEAIEDRKERRRDRD
ncbi:MAG: hypothetical protein EXR79_04305 [Myxococcales bacterium]|nr:hypothetical protein [Myxococcales bacterium]